MTKLSISTEKLVFLIIGGLTILALIFISVFAFKEQEQSKNIFNYKTNDQKRPQIHFLSTTADLGRMKVNDEKTTAFSIFNSGQKPLQLFNITSSCNCTFGKLTINGKESPEFNMHSKSSWTGTLTPGQEATLTVIYRPSLMPVKGTITRQVFVETNDPKNKRLTFSIRAFVE